MDFAVNEEVLSIVFQAFHGSVAYVNVGMDFAVNEEKMVMDSPEKDTFEDLGAKTVDFWTHNQSSFTKFQGYFIITMGPIL
jgi:hypothetical protein